MSATNARGLLSRSAHYREQGSIDLAKAVAQAAQAEATLELAEQQRIASIIEYVKVAANGIDTQDKRAVEYLSGLTDQVREGLNV